MGCPRPLDIEEAWVYRQKQHGNKILSMLIDPYQTIYPNDTVVHYKCEDNSRPAHYPEAAAVRCIDGEWIAQLVSCGKLPYLAFSTVIKVSYLFLQLLQQ